jgi:1,4-alpha-glucan branching enzyme
VETPLNTAGNTSSETTEMASFSYEAPHAHAVYLIGDFNGWNHTSNPMERQADGSWWLQVPLSHGRHYYQFLVDGQPVLDPHAMYVPLRDRHELVSFIALD